MSSARASELLSDVSPAMNRFRALLPESPFPGAVALEVLFEGLCRVQSSPDSRTALSLCSSITQFAKDVGIRSPSHLGEVLNGKRRGSCQGWRGHRSFFPEALPQQQVTLIPMTDSEQQDQLSLWDPMLLDLADFLEAEA